MNELLKLIENNARYEVKDLAACLGEEDDTIGKQLEEYRKEGIIEDYEKDGVIAGYHTIINWEKADVEITKAIIFVSCVPERVAGYDKIAERISRYPEVESLYLISGKAEFLLQVNGKNMREVSSFVAHKLAPTDGVNGTETMFVLKEYKKYGVSFFEGEHDDERLLVTP